ncbi:Uncharacterized protein GBIM_14958 [Gryllus bimaculatus]|nr:Uncharacterized protein GBIM_14958 [Gryllus bimaculatus]
MNMINKSIIAVIVLLTYISLCSSANILVLFTLASRSVHFWHTPLLSALANKGHNLTVISPDAQKKPIPNLTDIQIDGMYKDVSGQWDYEELTDSSTFFWITETFVYFERACTYALKSKSFKQLVEYPPDFKFDLVLIEPIGVECLLGILPKFGNPPIVSISSFGLPQWVLDISGTSANPSYVPYALLSYDDKMKFPERMNNFFSYLYSYILYYYNYLPSMNREARNYFGSEIPSVYDTLRNVSITLSNYHPTFNTPLPTTPNLIPIAAIQVKDPNPPTRESFDKQDTKKAKLVIKDIQTFLDEATGGAIYFSLGSNVRSDKLSLVTRKAILEAFAELPQRVLWKFESDLPDAPKNVKISKWLPQNDILDQHTNIKKLVKLGCGIQLEYKNLRKDTLLRALREVIRNPSETFMKHFLFTGIFLLSYVSIINSANILVLYTLASRSVHIWHTPLLTALANKGHNLTVISPDAQKTPVPNLTDLQVDGMYEGLTDQYAREDLTESSTFYWIAETFAYFENACSFVLKSDRIKQLLDYPPDFKFDLVLIEPVGSECLLGILPKFGNPPIVSVSSLALPQWVLEITGTSANPSYVPYAYLPHDDKMKFPERMYNSIAYLYSYVLYNYNYLPNMDREARYFFGSDIPSVYNTLKDTSITLSNYHPTLDTPLPTTPNLIPIAAIQVKEPKPLPADIQTFLDEATEGAIYFSLGSNVRSDKLSLATRKAIIEAFAELPQRVLWKFESDLPDAPKNVKISKWLPQNDILGK